MARDIAHVQLHGNSSSQQSIHLLANPLRMMRIRNNCDLSNTFGMVRNQGTKAHQGWDIEARLFTPIYAVADGTIEFVSTVDADAYGEQICLKFQYGPKTYWAFYAHLSQVGVVGGQKVKQGDEIGKTGKTGNASDLPAGQEHLHFEIRTIPHPSLGLAGRMDPAILLGSYPMSCPDYNRGGDLGKKTDAAFNF
jgi:peptidoglycan LD-endopeptidase LytH